MQDLRSAHCRGEVPDLYISFNGNMPGLKERGLTMDLKPLFQQSKVDLSRFRPNYLDDIQYAVTEKGELYGLPIETGFHALYYNKEIFDKFGVAYPKDGMTMEDAVGLAKRLTRLDNGVQYRGWDIGSIVRLAQPLGLEYIDRKTEKAMMSGEGWKRVFELGREIYSIPGNEPSKDPGKNRLDGFVKDRSIAMLSETNLFSRLKEAEKDGLQWDVVQSPFYKDRPNVYGNSTVYMVGAVPSTKHMDQVLQVIEVLTSDEVQMNVSKAGRISPLNNDAVQKAFGQDDPSLKTKNVSGIVKSQPVKYPIYLYREIAEPLTIKKFDELLSGSGDVNAALRELDEEMNKAIQIEKK
ncbi:extracellular solute-binding protein [Paenibacillus sp. P25]|nr:extracellular solute-binding protein [Paenibacillus sp. P25]